MSGRPMTPAARASRFVLVVITVIVILSMSIGSAL